MENQTQSRNIILTYGLIYGAVIVVINLLIYVLGITLSTTGAIINIIALAFCIIALPILAIKKFKSQNNGFLIWGQALKIGVGVVALGAFISILYTYFFTGIIEPNFYSELNEFKTRKILESSINDDQIKAELALLASQAKTQGSIIGAAQGLLFYVFLGFVVSAITGAVMKNTTEENQY
ncbi:DUF4199 domain-containing protein [Tenacibaculum aestuariivivum]|uniref:DUF4199 domain-containing protein n=1 Tax=Tenacibaculum aestuariivivum TaxID=2006131 RepID=UPI003AB50E1D